MKKIIYALCLFSFFLISNKIIAQNTQNIFLWNAGTMPGGEGPESSEKINYNGSVIHVPKPCLIVHTPQKPNGSAVLVISGGGYAHIELGNESTPVANWLTNNGFTTFELVYRLPQEGWNTTAVPFQDAQRAMKIIRSLASKYSVNSNKIGIMGFSAGGHLAGITGTSFDTSFYAPVDAIDSFSSRPDFLALLYPVITMLPPYNKTHSHKIIINNNEDEFLYSVEKRVNKNTPVTFIAQSIDDPISPINNSYLMRDALTQNEVPFELHIFKTGGHGWGMGKNDEVKKWSFYFLSWAKMNGFTK